MIARTTGIATAWPTSSIFRRSWAGAAFEPYPSTGIRGSERLIASGPASISERLTVVPSTRTRLSSTSSSSRSSSVSVRSPRRMNERSGTSYG